MAKVDDDTKKLGECFVLSKEEVVICRDRPHLGKSLFDADKRGMHMLNSDGQDTLEKRRSASPVNDDKEDPRPAFP